MAVRRKKIDVIKGRIDAIQRIQRAIDYLTTMRGLEFIRLELDGESPPKAGRVLVYNVNTGERLADFHRPGAAGNWTPLEQLAPLAERMAGDWGMEIDGGQDTQSNPLIPKGLTQQTELL